MFSQAHWHCCEEGRREEEEEEGGGWAGAATSNPNTHAWSWNVHARSLSRTPKHTQTHPNTHTQYPSFPMFLPRSYTRHARNINAKRESLLKLAEFSVELSGVEFTSKFKNSATWTRAPFKDTNRALLNCAAKRSLTSHSTIFSYGSPSAINQDIGAQTRHSSAIIHLQHQKASTATLSPHVPSLR